MQARAMLALLLLATCALVSATLAPPIPPLQYSFAFRANITGPGVAFDEYSRLYFDFENGLGRADVTLFGQAATEWCDYTTNEVYLLELDPTNTPVCGPYNVSLPPTCAAVPRLAYEAATYVGQESKFGVLCDVFFLGQVEQVTLNITSYYVAGTGIPVAQVQNLDGLYTEAQIWDYVVSVPPVAYLTAPAYCQPGKN
eukprot:m.305024 g.305024  ORF g.305024 m.305024 type:complete len:198 (+) comp55279_c0_seq2:2209-2802(+)